VTNSTVGVKDGSGVDVGVSVNARGIVSVGGGVAVSVGGRARLVWVAATMAVSARLGVAVGDKPAKGKLQEDMPKATTKDSDTKIVRFDNMVPPREFR
jgi:hypothetical protein